MEEQVWKMSCPQNVLITGSSGVGKSSFVVKLLETPSVWDNPPDKILYSYGICSETVNHIARHMPEVTLIEGIPRNLCTPLEIFSPHQNNVLICDDLSNETQNSKDFTSFLMRGSHHSNCCLISIEHFLFAQSAQRRLQSPQFNQIIMYKSNRSYHQIGTLARQIALKNPKLLQWAYSDAISKPYSYLVVDLRNETPDELRLLTNVFGENDLPTFIYL